MDHRFSLGGAAGGAALVLAACGSEPASPPPSASDVADAARAPTYHRDIAPLLGGHCGSCHVEGGLGPFPLARYEDARSRHDAIARAVASRRMPPWLPSDACQTFRDARRLDRAAIDVIAAWSRAGAPEGDPREAKGAIAPPPARALPWVDATVDIGADYVARPADEGAPTDDWRCFALDPALLEDRMLVGYDLVPTARAEVHHAAFVEADLATARAKDAAEPGVGWPCPGATGVGADRVLGSWASGFGAVTFPEGTGIRLGKGQGKFAENLAISVNTAYSRLRLARAAFEEHTRAYREGELP